MVAISEATIVLKQCDLAMDIVEYEIAKWEELQRTSRINARRDEWSSFHPKGVL